MSKTQVRLNSEEELEQVEVLHETRCTFRFIHRPKTHGRLHTTDITAILRLLVIGLALLVAVVFVIWDSPDLAGQVLRYLPGL
jgi:hypothetical protein